MRPPCQSRPWLSRPAQLGVLSRYDLVRRGCRSGCAPAIERTGYGFHGPAQRLTVAGSAPYRKCEQANCSGGHARVGDGRASVRRSRTCVRELAGSDGSRTWRARRRLTTCATSSMWSCCAWPYSSSPQWYRPARRSRLRPCLAAATALTADMIARTKPRTTCHRAQHASPYRRCSEIPEAPRGQPRIVPRMVSSLSTTCPLNLGFCVRGTCRAVALEMSSPSLRTQQRDAATWSWTTILGRPWFSAARSGSRTSSGGTGRWLCGHRMSQSLLRAP